MKNIDILKAMSHIDERYINEAEVKTIKKKPAILKRSLMAAACIALILVSMCHVRSRNNNVPINKVIAVNDTLMMNNANIVSLVTLGDDGDVVISEPDENEDVETGEVLMYSFEDNFSDLIEYDGDSTVMVTEIISDCNVIFGFLPGENGEANAYTAEYEINDSKYMIVGKDIDMDMFIDMTSMVIVSVEQNDEVIYVGENTKITEAK